MTITDTITAYVAIAPRFDFDTHAPAVSGAVAALHKAAVADSEKAGLDRGLVELIRLRASQLNGCAYCVETHTVDARAGGVSSQRVDLLPVWAEAPVYTVEERAAFALVESVVNLAQTHVPATVVEEALAVLGEAKTAAVLGLTISISAWNQIGVTSRCWPVDLRKADEAL
jgi:AhpD family alkylhydroperoxidase